jgi:hypothetical protein
MRSINDLPLELHLLILQRLLRLHPTAAFLTYIHSNPLVYRLTNDHCCVLFCRSTAPLRYELRLARDKFLGAAAIYRDAAAADEEVTVIMEKARQHEVAFVLLSLLEIELDEYSELHARIHGWED